VEYKTVFTFHPVIGEALFSWGFSRVYAGQFVLPIREAPGLSNTGLPANDPSEIGIAYTRTPQNLTDLGFIAERPRAKVLEFL
jgi:hypothetical protein